MFSGVPVTINSVGFHQQALDTETQRLTISILATDNFDLHPSASQLVESRSTSTDDSRHCSERQ